ncbi:MULTISPECIES: DUF1189 family protein [Pontibacillus]|uniref:DUF1189 family protein n=1 Tax=Pontibacillus chungwhensis TaxID=265426 RepID=A0ABY8UV95_9BACI|nr:MULTISPECIES: DUF1189 family protein [Pontibacillus]MCD5323588.1 DUF1189 domain-containing protein [Pontibacillus sp. HN14]WIF96957.1 DUF1189 family protein [Pontibacillus chungwhensis]
MKLSQQFLYSLYSFKRVSAFRMLKVGKPIGYVFFLTLLTMIPVLLGMIFDTRSTEAIGTLPLPVELLILYVISTSIKFMDVSILAFIGLGLNTYLKRKNIQYRHTWALSAYAITIPTLVLAIVENLGLVLSGDYVLYMAFSTVMLYIILQAIPKPKARTT